MSPSEPQLDRTPRNRSRLALAGVVALTGITLNVSWMRATVPSPPAASPSSASAGAAVPGQTYRHSCGLVEKFRPVVSTIPLHNPFSHPLKIVDSQVSCGCVKIEDAPDVIDAGQTSQMTVRLKASAYGHLQQRIVLLTDNEDPSASLFQIEVRAAVRGVRSIPTALRSDNVVSGGGQIHRVEIEAIGIRTSTVLEATCDSPHVRVSVRPRQDGANPAGDETVIHPIELSIAETAPPGALTTTLRTSVLADDQRQIVETPLTFSVLGLLQASPAKVVLLRNVPGGKNGGVSTIVISKGTTPEIDLASVKFTSDSEHVVIESREVDSQQAVLRVRLVDESSPSKTVMNSTITGSISGRSVVQIPVVGVLIPR